MMTSHVARPANWLVTLMRVAALAGYLCATSTPMVAQSPRVALPPIYYDDFERPWAVKAILENDFAGFADFEQQSLRAYMWGVGQFITKPPQRADPACARLGDPVLHARLESFGIQTAGEAAQIDIRNPNVFGAMDATARRMQSFKAAARAGQDDLYLLAADYGGCSGPVVARFLNNIKGIATRGF